MTTRRDALTTVTAAALLGGAAVSGLATAQVPPPYGTRPVREANRVPMTERLIAWRPTATTFGGATVEAARLGLGLGEEGGDNAGAFVDWLTQTPPNVTPAWCAAFVCAACFMASYGLQRPAPWETWRYGKDGGIDPELWVPNLARNAQRALMFVSGNSGTERLSRVKPGAVLFQRGGEMGWYHTGIVESVSGNTVHTIEGNVGASTSSTGRDTVKRLSRPLQSCDYGLTPT